MCVETIYKVNDFFEIIGHFRIYFMILLEATNVANAKFQFIKVRDCMSNQKNNEFNKRPGEIKNNSKNKKNLDSQVHK